MNISVFGLGYVGCVSLGCLAKLGYNVIGVDVNTTKVNLINKGLATIIEKDIDLLIMEGRKKGLISATNDYLYAVKNSDITFICVGTPNNEQGHLDLTSIRKVASEIGTGIKYKDKFHTVVIRSTVLPGTNEELAGLISEASGKKLDTDFCVMSNPEFLREGNAVEDFFNPGITVIGGTCAKGINSLKEIYKLLNTKIEIVEPKVAETIKLLNNSFHALKVAFINEVGTISKTLGINTNQLIDIFLKDTRLNISPAYLKPGFAYGGSCLPKDLKALKMLAYDANLLTPIINSIEESNRYQIERAIKIIESYNIKNIGFWGISFKEGTDDLRNSPIVDVIETLVGKNYKVSIYDKNVIESFLIGENKEFISKKLPYFKEIVLNDLNKLIEKSELLVINTKGNIDEYKLILENSTLKILDLKNIPELKKHKGYYGFNW